MGAHAEPHISPLKTYYIIYSLLLVLTVTTYAVSFAGFPPTTAVVVAVAVAMVKASLVGAWFMHLKYDVRFNVFVFLAAVWFMSVFFILTMFDIGTRGKISAIMDNHQYRLEMAAPAAAPTPTPATPAH
jgi:cytochrome c oxidase subunit IV